MPYLLPPMLFIVNALRGYLEFMSIVSQSETEGFSDILQVVVATGRLKDVRHLILVMKTLLCAPATTLPTLHALW